MQTIVTQRILLTSMIVLLFGTTHAFGYGCGLSEEEKKINENHGDLQRSFQATCGIGNDTIILHRSFDPFLFEYLESNGQIKLEDDNIDLLTGYVESLCASIKPTSHSSKLRLVVKPNFGMLDPTENPIIYRGENTITLVARLNPTDLNVFKASVNTYRTRAKAHYDDLEAANAAIVDYVP